MPRPYPGTNVKLSPDHGLAVTFSAEKDNAFMYLDANVFSDIYSRRETKLNRGHETQRLSTTRCDMVPGFQEKAA